MSKIVGSTKQSLETEHRLEPGPVRNPARRGAEPSQQPGCASTRSASSRATRKPRQCTTDGRWRTAGRIGLMMAPYGQRRNTPSGHALWGRELSWVWLGATERVKGHDNCACRRHRPRSD